VKKGDHDRDADADPDADHGLQENSEGKSGVKNPAGRKRRRSGSMETAAAREVDLDVSVGESEHASTAVAPVLRPLSGSVSSTTQADTGGIRAESDDDIDTRADSEQMDGEIKESSSRVASSDVSGAEAGAPNH